MYSKSYEEIKFYGLLFVLAVVAVPVIIVTIFHFADIGFLWFPVEIKK